MSAVELKQVKRYEVAIRRKDGGKTLVKVDTPYGEGYAAVQACAHVGNWNVAVVMVGLPR